MKFLFLFLFLSTSLHANQRVGFAFLYKEIVQPNVRCTSVSGFQGVCFRISDIPSFSAYPNYGFFNNTTFTCDAAPGRAVSVTGNYFCPPGPLASFLTWQTPNHTISSDGGYYKDNGGACSVTLPIRLQSFVTSNCTLVP